MAYDVHAMLEEVAGTVAATWADVLPSNAGGGIHGIGQIERRAFDDVADVGFPFAVFEMEPAGPGNYGLVNADMLANLNIYRVEREALTDESMWDKLEALKSAILAESYTGMNVIEFNAESVHPSNPILNFFLVRFVPYNAGMIGFQINYGESAL